MHPATNLSLDEIAQNPCCRVEKFYDSQAAAMQDWDVRCLSKPELLNAIHSIHNPER